VVRYLTDRRPFGVKRDDLMRSFVSADQIGIDFPQSIPNVRVMGRRRNERRQIFWRTVEDIDVFEYEPDFSLTKWGRAFVTVMYFCVKSGRYTQCKDRQALTQRRDIGFHH